MQPLVAFLHMSAGSGAYATDTGMAPMPRPIPSPKRVMVPRHFSKMLTITSLDWSEVCLRQGCTLLATYKCTLGHVGGFGNTGETSGYHWQFGGL